MKKLLLHITLMLCTTNAMAQKYALKDTMLVDSLLGTAKQMYRADLQGALNNCHTALYISKEIESDIHIGRSYNGIGIMNNMLGRTDSAIYNFEKAFDYLSTSKDYLYAYGIRLNISELYFENGKVITAFNYINQSMHVFDSVGDTYGRLVSRMNLARLYSKMDLKNEAKNLYQQTIHINEFKDTSFTIQVYTNLGGLFLDKENQDSAKYYLENALKLAEIKKQNYDLVSIYINLGDALHMGKEYKNAKTLYFKGLELNKNFGANFNTAFGNARLCRLYLNTGDFDSAIYHGKIAEKVAKNSGDYVFLEDLYYDLHNLMDTVGNKDEALKYLHLYVDVQDSIKNKEVLRQIERYKYELELKKSDKELEELEKEQKSNKRQILNQRIVGIITISLLIVLAVLLIILNRQSKRYLTANQELAKANNVKNKIIATMTHDLRAPIASLFTLVNLANRDLLDEEQTEDMKQNLERNLGNTLSIVDNLLYWSKNQIAEIKPQLDNVDISKLIIRNIEIYSSIAKSKNIMIECTLAEAKMVKADKTLMDLVIRNLIANAVKFTLNKGKVSVITEELDSNRLKIIVKDTGVGIPPEKIDALFTEETYTNDGTEGETGTGLGLLVSKEFIKMHNSKLVVESEVGVGSKFSFELSLA